MNNRMPKGINFLYLIQIAITFSYAVIYSSLSLYLTRKIGFTQKASGDVVGLFLAFNFALHLVAGYIGGRFISNRLLLLLSIFAQMLGFFFLGLNSESTVFIGLSFFLVGCGFNVTCYNCILVSRFNSGDNGKRESASFISYFFLNIGFLLGFASSGYFESYSDYNALFNLGNIFNIIALLVIGMSWKFLKEDDVPLSSFNEKEAFKKGMLGIVIVLICIPLMLVGFKFSVITNSLVVILGAVVFTSIYFMSKKEGDEEKKKNILLFILLSFSSIIFWMLYFVGPMSVTLFIKNNTDAHIMGHVIQPQWFNNINAAIVILGSPLLAVLFRKLNDKQVNIPEYSKFSLAIFLISLSFAMLVYGINHTMDNGLVGARWIVLYYIFQSSGELFIGPVGYAMVGRLAPPHMRGVLMGAFMLSSGIAASLSSYFASLITSSSNASTLATNQAYYNAFFKLGEYGAFFAVLSLIVCSLMMKKNTIKS